ncbi:hypothetical protein AGMMS49965_14070 [Bacteroidia bacterium]|nr:hypothetical protein AGMMS49965_14070 [Bacteroidia bacterium]
MLKSWFKYVFVGVFSFIFMLAAAGHNLVTYCCERCEAAAQHHTADNPYDDACQIIHLQTDDFSISDSDVLLKAPVRDGMPAFAAISLFSYEPIFAITASYTPPDNPVFPFGRAILASNCVLLI